MIANEKNSSNTNSSKEKKIHFFEKKFSLPDIDMSTFYIVNISISELSPIFPTPITTIIIPLNALIISSPIRSHEIQLQTEIVEPHQGSIENTSL